MEKFYDSISIVKLIDHALGSDFPPRALGLLLQVHLSTRLLRVNTWVSEPIMPYNSIIAGCKSSGHLARVLLYPLLEEHHRLYVPRPNPLHFRCFVDDLVLRFADSSSVAAEEEFVDTFHEVLQDLKRRKLTYSESKTVIKSNDPKVAASVALRLRARGTPVRCNEPVKDLGTPVGSGKRRIATQANARLAKSKGRSSRSK